MLNNQENKTLSIAMLGHKVVPSRRGGIELVLTTIAPLLVSHGYDVTCFNRAGDEVENEYIGTVKEEKYKGVKLITVPAIKKRGLSAVTASVFAALRAALGNYDVVHFHAEGPCAMIWLPKILGKKCVVTVHGLDWQRDKWHGGLGAKYILFGERCLAKYADSIIVLSQGVQDYFREKYGRTTIMIPNGVEKPVHREPKLIKEKYGLNGRDYILLLSRLTAEKGVHYLIEAYQQLQKTNSTLGKKLVIAGAESDTYDYLEKLQKMANGNLNIIFTGFVSGAVLDELYSNAYIHCIPSNLEGMPLGLLEAMSYGNAVLGSDIPEIADVVEDKAVLFNHGNVDDLREKLQMLLDCPSKVEKLRRESADFILAKYNWQEVARATEHIYRQVTAKLRS